MQVARAEEKGGYALEPPHRAITVRDLLRHTSGLIYPGMDFADSGSASEAIHALYNSKRIFRSDGTLADFVTGLAAFPLAHQPGEVWEYSGGPMCSRGSSRSRQASHSMCFCDNGSSIP
jgi:CubicO group peptidase (beta-lactamase class C family)